MHCLYGSGLIRDLHPRSSDVYISSSFRTEGLVDCLGCELNKNRIMSIPPCESMFCAQRQDVDTKILPFVGGDNSYCFS